MLRAEAVVLLHQFSEWIERNRVVIGLQPDLTHDDLVFLFLEERAPSAQPALVQPERATQAS
jgi:hypothetical protein